MLPCILAEGERLGQGEAISGCGPLAILTFIYAWNNFFWPFIVINSTEMMTIPIGITQVQSWYGIACSRQMASVVLAALPAVVLYLIFQGRVAEGVAITSGIK